MKHRSDPEIRRRGYQTWHPDIRCRNTGIRTDRGFGPETWTGGPEVRMRRGNIVGCRSRIRDMTPGLIAAAAVVAIFVLSGDKELVEVGDKSRIPYKDYHNYYRQSLLTGGAWADGVFNFFNNSLFATSSSAALTLLDSDLLVGDLTSGPHDSWEEMFERAMETGTELPELDVSPVIEVSPSAPPTAPQSISAAMQGLALAENCRQDPPLPVAVNEDEPELPVVVLEAPVAAQKPKPKPKLRQKGKADITNTNTSEDQGLANVELLSVVSGGNGMRRGRSKTAK
ncbi:hypothetical protein EV424DRAFT_1356184 [Suillus variegatus]|nr:hypothetical protein EV424DRAFT_1356184 [Suillus variegatus]